MQSIISIIIPFYNTQEYLKECLDSILSQSYKNLDIILVDDGSSDKSLDIALEYASKDSRIFIIKKHNSGQSSARNIGLEFILNTNLRSLVCNNDISRLTKDFPSLKQKLEIIDKNFISLDLKTIDFKQDLPSNQYIQFIDSDDFIAPDSFLKCMDVFKQKDSKIIFFKTQTQKLVSLSLRFDAAFNGIKKRLIQDGESLNEVIKTSQILGYDFIEDFPFVCSGIFEASVLNVFKLRFEDKIECEDHLFGILFFSSSDNVVLLDEFLYTYRIRADSTCGWGNKKDEITLSPITSNLAKHFKDNLTTKQYYHAYSFGIVALRILSNKEHFTPLVLKKFIYTFAKRSLLYKKFKQDPLDGIKAMKPVKDFIKDQGFLYGLKIRYSKVSKVMHLLKRALWYLRFSAKVTLDALGIKVMVKRLIGMDVSQNIKQAEQKKSNK